MGDLIQFLPFKLNKELKAMESAQAEQAKFEHEICQIAFEGGPTVEVPMTEEAIRNVLLAHTPVLTCQNGETMEVYGTELPSDCG